MMVKTISVFFSFVQLPYFVIQREEYKTYTSSLPFQIPGGPNQNQLFSQGINPVFKPCSANNHSIDGEFIVGCHVAVIGRGTLLVGDDIMGVTMGGGP